MKWCFIYILDNPQFISVGKAEESLKMPVEGMQQPLWLTVTPPYFLTIYYFIVHYQR